MTADPRYPVGRFDPEDKTPVGELIDQLAELPDQLMEAVNALGEEKLDRPYREGGWTARQVVHHLADSHLNAYTRFRLALTEERPTIKGYNEKLWAELPDARTGPVQPSLALIEGLHDRWVWLLRGLKGEDLQRVFVHPERGEMTLERTLRLYAWHCRHHLGHLEVVKGLGL
jgi:uncharacterized damage-inducible protein DinB